MYKIEEKCTPTRVNENKLQNLKNGYNSPKSGMSEYK